MYNTKPQTQNRNNKMHHTHGPIPALPRTCTPTQNRLLELATRFCKPTRRAREFCRDSALFAAGYRKIADVEEGDFGEFVRLLCANWRFLSNAIMKLKMKLQGTIGGVLEEYFSRADMGMHWKLTETPCGENSIAVCVRELVDNIDKLKDSFADAWGEGGGEWFELVLERVEGLPKVSRLFELLSTWSMWRIVVQEAKIKRTLYLKQTKWIRDKNRRTLRPNGGVAASQQAWKDCRNWTSRAAVERRDRWLQARGLM